MQINEHIIKFTGEVSIDSPLENGSDYMLGVQGGIEGLTEKPNHDGTANLIYKFRPSVVLTTTKKGQTVKSLDKKRNGQKFRNMVNYYRQQNYPEIEEEDFYDKFMAKAMANFDDIADMLSKR